MVNMKKVSRDTIAREKAKEENIKRRAKFAPMTNKEAAQLSEEQKSTLNSKRQNYVQALFDYAAGVFKVQHMGFEYSRLQDLLTKDKWIDAHDELGLRISKEEFKVIVKAKYADFRITSAKIESKKQDIMKVWNMTEEEIEAQINDWILGNQKIY